jgi:hypothetical protein
MAMAWLCRRAAPVDLRSAIARDGLDEKRNGRLYFPSPSGHEGCGGAGSGIGVKFKVKAGDEASDALALKGAGIESDFLRYER